MSSRALGCVRQATHPTKTIGHALVCLCWIENPPCKYDIKPELLRVYWKWIDKHESEVQVLIPAQLRIKIQKKKENGVYSSIFVVWAKGISVILWCLLMFLKPIFITWCLNMLLKAALIVILSSTIHTEFLKGVNYGNIFVPEDWMAEERITWPEFWPLMVETDQISEIQASDWSRQITWPEY